MQAAIAYSRQRAGRFLHRRRRRQYRLSQRHARPMARARPVGGRRPAAQARRDHVAKTARALIARAGRGSAQGDDAAFDIDLVKADGTTFPCAILHRLPRHGGAAARACAGPQSRAGRARGGRRRRAQILRGCSTRPRSPSPRSTATAPSARPTPPSCACSDAPSRACRLALDGLVDPESRPALRRALDAASPGRA